MILVVGVTGEPGVPAVGRRDDPAIVAAVRTRREWRQAAGSIAVSQGGAAVLVTTTQGHDDFTGGRAPLPRTVNSTVIAWFTVEGSGSSDSISTVALVF